MKLLHRGLAALCALAALAASPVVAQSKLVAAPATIVPQSAMAYGAVGSVATAVSNSSPLPSAGPLLAPVATSAAASSLVAKASPGNLYGFSGYSTVSGWFLIFNATSAPADGAVTPADFYPYTAAQAFAVDYSGAPLRGSTGLTIVFSTTGPYTKTASATASISAKVQ